MDTVHALVAGTATTQRTLHNLPPSLDRSLWYLLFLFFKPQLPSASVQAMIRIPHSDKDMLHFLF